MLVTLLTDFGLEDEYVGVVKGVILRTNPSAQIVDLSHRIPPGDLDHAAAADAGVQARCELAEDPVVRAERIQNDPRNRGNEDYVAAPFRRRELPRQNACEW